MLVRWETTPDDLAGMIAAEGILTSHGGKTSHAAVIARGMGAPCVCGVEALKIDAEQEGGRRCRHRRRASRGRRHLHRRHHRHRRSTALSTWSCPSLPATLTPSSSGRTSSAQLGVRANADNPDDAQLSRDFGAEGIGLCRTEHMFLGDRKQIIQTFILNEDEEIRQKAADQLYEAQTGDFYGMFKAMDGLPVIVRLLDPPLHEFLESPRALEVEIAKAEAAGAPAAELAEKRALLAKIDSFVEANPMLGLRGCRLGIVYPILPVHAGSRYRNCCCSSLRRKASIRSPRS